MKSLAVALKQAQKTQAAYLRALIVLEEVLGEERGSKTLLLGAFSDRVADDSDLGTFTPASLNRKISLLTGRKKSKRPPASTTT